jgi:hypothetical protein
MARGRSTSATPKAVIAFDFISARIAAAPFIGKETVILPCAEWLWARLMESLGNGKADSVARPAD